MLTQDTTTTRRRRRPTNPDARPTVGRTRAGRRSAYEAGAGVADDDVQRFVARTTTTSGVPVYVEDAGVLDQLARLLS
ncbi:MAG TPA: hypothetical protein VN306_06420 [Mycobacterium sp.]|nr:hypothetical protein [Mycobacterium sp.]